MTSDDFKNVFTDCVVSPLRSFGFAVVGQSLYFGDEHKQVALIRGGGRLARPGCATHILALRHSYMRETSSALTVPDSPPRYCEHYPFLLDPAALSHTTTADWHFSPDRHMSKPWGRIQYADTQPSQLTDLLETFAGQILTRWLPWGDELDALLVSDQLSRHSNFWAARLWQEDCQNQIGKDKQN